jgi:signal transduction histidine kinase
VIIRKAVSVIAANQLAENIEIVQQLDQGLPKVKVDENQLVQVILNIALNAIESMPEGGTLTVSTCRQETDEEGDVFVTIRDTGAGISATDLKNIFKPFFTTRERGVGLGLAICQKIIKEHGGSIRVHSAVSQGATFIIKLKSSEWV